MFYQILESNTTVEVFTQLKILKLCLRVFVFLIVTFSVFFFN